MAPLCPHCGGRLTLTPEGLYVCPRCGLVVSVFIDGSPVRPREDRGFRRARNALRRWRPVKMLPPLTHAPTIRSPASPDPILLPALRVIRSDKSLSGRRPSTLMALAHVAAAMARGYTARRAIEEAASKYNVSAKTLRDLARRHRRTLAEARERVAESWRQSARRRDT